MRLRILVMTSAAAFGLLVSPAPAAIAVSETQLVADPLPTWQVSGKVWALAYSAGVVYVGGTFSAIRPPGASAGTQEVPRANFAAFDAVTGEPLSTCAPSFSAPIGTTPSIQALEMSSDGNTLYIGGRFSEVSGVASEVTKSAAGNFVALRTSDCTRKRGYPNFGSAVNAFAPTVTAVYAGGAFTRVSGQVRQRLAAFAPTGALLPWAPTADAAVQALTATPEPVTRVYAGGDFLNINGQAIQGLVALAPDDGQTVQDFPGWIVERESVKALAHDDQYFYLAAEGTGAGQFDGRIAADVRTGVLHWRDTCTGATQDIEPYNGVLYSASHAHDCSRVAGGFPDYAMDGRQHLLGETIDNDVILPWFPDTNEGPGNVGVGPYALIMAGTEASPPAGVQPQLWVGGEFTTVNKKQQQGLTRFPTGPDTGSPEKTIPTATSPSSGVVSVSWPATWDRDNGVLTYYVYRDAQSDPLHSTTVDSRFWSRPTMIFSDTGLESGSTHSYRVAVGDGENTSARSAAAIVTVK